MKKPIPVHSLRSQGSALLIVLLFLVLLTILTVAFLSRATLERQLSGASFSQSKVDLVAQGSIATIIADLQQEIEAGSNVGAGTTIPTLANGYYYPNAPATMVPYPVLSGVNHATPPAVDGLENLLKISYRGAPFYAGSNYNTSTYPAPTRAPSTAAAVSTTTASLNNRAVTTVRWNAPLLLARQTPTSTTDYTPISAFTAPDWIYVARDGSNPSVWDSSYIYKPNISLTGTSTAGTPGTNPVTQRYAYTIYDEGGTLDLNVAGNPSYNTASVTYSSLQPYKNALTYADLTQLPYLSTSAMTAATGSSTTMSVTTQIKIINAIVGWRNNSSGAVNGSFPSYSSFPTTISSSIKTTLGISYSGYPLDYYALNSNGFINTGGLLLRAGNNAGNNISNQTDNVFTSRQQLIQFFTQGLGQNSTFSASLAALENSLQYLGTFSRDLSQPSYAPNPAKVTNAPILTEANGGNDEGGLVTSTTSNGFDNTLNPAFLNVTATSTFTRNDGTTAIAGEPLVKKRFALMRLAWLTYMGPSAGRTIPTTNPGVGTTNYDMWLLVNTYGIPASFLAQGTAANIYKYFGLSWIPDTRQDIYGTNMDSGQTSKWVYNHTSANPAVGTTTSPITALPSHPSSRNASGTAPYTTIYTLSQVASAGRDPDFVELLKAAICAGSIGKQCWSGGSVGNYQFGLDESVDTQIMQTAANIIAQYKTDFYAPRILFDDGNWSMAQEYRGVEDMPYFWRTRTLVFPVLDATPSVSYTPAVSWYSNAPTGNGYRGSAGAGDPYRPPPTEATNTALTESGIGVAFNAVEIWNPHSWNTSASAPELTALRPTQFRLIAVDGPPTIAAPPSPIANDPNTLTMQGETRLGPQSPGDYETSSTTVTMTGTGANVIHSIQFTPTNSGLCFTIPQSALGLALFREPTMLIKPGIPYGSKLHFAGDSGGLGAAIEGTNQVFNTNPASSNGEAAIQSYISADPVSTFKGIKAGKVGGTQVSGDYPGTYVNNNLYLGTYLGSFPMRWSSVDSNQTGSPTLVYAAFTDIANGGVNLTYRLQYLDPSNNWITYDEKYTWTTAQGRGLNMMYNGPPSYLTWKLMGNNADGQNNEYLDPRTSRFGSLNNNYAYNNGGDTMGSWSIVPNTLTASQSNATWGVRVDESSTLSGIRSFTSGVPGWYPGWAPASGTSSLYPGLFCQNNIAMTSPQAQFFADADGIVRRGMSGYVRPTATQPAVTRPGGTSTFTSPTAASGLASTVATDYTNAAAPGTTPGTSTGAGAVQVNGGMEAPSRPIILNRPFRSVAELGYVFSGTPWRNLDMMTPESGAAALLDVFCINDTNDPNGLVAGKVDLNTRQAPVLQAILSGAYKNEFAPTTTTIAGTGTSPVAAANVIAAGLVSRTTSTTTPGGPLANISELVGKYNSNVTQTLGTSPNTISFIDGSQTYAGFSGTQSPLTTGTIPSSPANLSSILYSDSATSGLPNNYDSANVERYREATIRALSNTTTARVWNLMIDVIAQTGRFPSSASSLANFNVEGERRYWVHVAIDRYTGKVLDEQIEEVKE